MKPVVQIMLSFLLTFGVPLALAVRELMFLRRKGGGPGWGGPGRKVGPPPPTPGGTPSLPPCLFVPPTQIQPVGEREPRVRVLEPA